MPFCPADGSGCVGSVDTTMRRSESGFELTSSSSPPLGLLAGTSGIEQAETVTKASFSAFASAAARWKKAGTGESMSSVDLTGCKSASSYVANVPSTSEVLDVGRFAGRLELEVGACAAVPDAATDEPL